MNPPDFRPAVEATASAGSTYELVAGYRAEVARWLAAGEREPARQRFAERALVALDYALSLARPDRPDPVLEAGLAAGTALTLFRVAFAKTVVRDEARQEGAFKPDPSPAVKWAADLKPDWWTWKFKELAEKATAARVIRSAAEREAFRQAYYRARDKKM